MALGVTNKDGPTSPVSILFEFKSDMGKIAWKTATMKETPTSATQGKIFVFTWDSKTDLSGKFLSDVQLRATPNNGSLAGSAVELSSVVVNNVTLADASDVHIGNSFHNMNTDGDVQIVFQSTAADTATITIYDLLGRKVRTFSKSIAAGFTTLSWHMKDDSGKLVASDVYAIHVKGPGVDKKIKISLFK
jgi:hypothetical protein